MCLCTIHHIIQQYKKFRHLPRPLPELSSFKVLRPAASTTMGLRNLIPDASTVLKWTGAAVCVTIGAGGALLYSFQTLLIYPSYMPEGVCSVKLGSGTSLTFHMAHRLAYTSSDPGRV